jgi:hypothetical protein
MPGDAGNPQSDSVRLSIKITPHTWKALDLVADREDVSVAEALRHLVGYGELVYRTIRVDGDEVLIRSGRSVDCIVLEQP